MVHEAQEAVAQGGAEAGEPQEQERELGGAEAREERLVPVSEAIRYRKRAQAAEQEIELLRGKLKQVEGELTEAQRTAAYLERRQRIDELLAESEAIDLEAARLLTEHAVAQMDEPDVKLAVEDLRRRKPYLFRQRIASGSGAMAVRPSGDAEPAEEAAQRAVQTGDRRDLLRYLRVRRHHG